MHTKCNQHEKPPGLHAQDRVALGQWKLLDWLVAITPASITPAIIAATTTFQHG